MPRDLLFFRPSEQRSIVNPQRRGPSLPHVPSFGTQNQRVPQMFRELSRVVANRGIRVQADVQGIDSEFVLVFEIAGTIDNFNKAVVRAGLEWLSCEDSEGTPDEDFYSLNSRGERTDSPVNQKLYLTMSNTQALNNLRGLWEQYVNSPDHKLPRGFGAFANLFSQLRNVRKWDRQDRFSTGVLNAWREILELNPDIIKFEIELWYRNTEEKRVASENRVRQIVEDCEGRIIRIVRYDMIQYHAMVVEVPANVVRDMMDANDTSLLDEEQVMWFRATGQTSITSEVSESTEEDSFDNNTFPQSTPLVALLDGLPIANHQYLRGRLIIDDPDDFESDYIAKKREHGSAMASLIVWGDLNAGMTEPLSSPLVVRPIMKSNGTENDNQKESIPSDELLVDLLHRSVLRLMSEPQTRTVKIINLSIGCFDRPFFFAMSPESKMLDYLSNQFNVLFVVSTGNTGGWLNPTCTAAEYERANPEERAAWTYSYIWNNLPDYRILSPSESINALSIGSLHYDISGVQGNNYQMNPLPDNLPATYSRFGGGKNRSLKPDAILQGGKVFYRSNIFGSQPAEIHLPDKNPRGIGHKAVSASTPTSTITLSGTSNSTALASRLCAQLLENLHRHIAVPSDYDAVAAKCLFIHSCDWGNLGKELQIKYVPQSGKEKEKVARWIGYGYPIIERSLFCEDNRVTLVGYGSISQNNYVEFRFPLPNCLQAQHLEKKLTITLAWMSPIDVNTKKYRLANLEFKSNCDDVGLVQSTRQEADNNISRRGTVQHEVFKGSSASAYGDGTDLVIKVLCKKEDKLSVPIKYVLMATLEVAPETGLPIYQEVAARLQNPVGIGIS